MQVVPWLVQAMGTTGAAAGTATATGAAAGASAAGALAPLSAGVSAGAAASTAAGITAGTITPTVTAAAGGLGGAVGGAAKFLAKTAAATGAASLLAPKPSIPTAPKPPTVDEARMRMEAADRLKAKKGGAAAILTGKLGDTSPTQTATKTLLGA